MAFTYTWNSAFKSAPSDTENVSQGAGRIRDLKEAIAERMKVAHSWAGDADDGTLLGSAVADSIGFVSGTDMLFVQASAPTGWTQITAVNDRVLRLVSGTGAGTGGSWTISGLTHAHTHTFDTPAHKHELPMSEGNNTLDNALTATFGTGSTTINSSDMSATDASSGDAALSGSTIFSDAGGTTDAASTNAVSSTGAWRPSYIDVIQASKD